MRANPRFVARVPEARPVPFAGVGAHPDIRPRPAAYPLPDRPEPEPTLGHRAGAANGRVEQRARRDHTLDPDGRVWGFRSRGVAVDDVPHGLARRRPRR